jgi:cystathionine beta-synthase
MLEHGFLERQAPLPTVDEVLIAKHGGQLPDLVTISAHQKVGEGIDTMQRYGISQLPVTRDGSCESLADLIGSLQDRALLERVFSNPDVLHEDVASAMQPPLGAVETTATLEDVFATLSSGANAIVICHDGRPTGVLTRSDLLEFLAHRR